jgi:hypothetical protein
MLRMEIIPIDGSERTKTILSLRLLVEPTVAFAAGSEPGSTAACCPKPWGARAMTIMTESRKETAELDIGMIPRRRMIASFQVNGKRNALLH